MNESTEFRPLPSVGVLVKPTPAEVAQIVALESETFNWEVSNEDMKELADTVQQSENIVGVIRTADQEIVGYLVAVPAIKADKSIVENDSGFKPSELDLYIETFAIASKYRLIQTSSLIQTLATEAALRGFKKLVAHVPENHVRLYTAFGAQALRTITKWYDSDEPHVYIEYTITSS